MPTATLPAEIGNEPDQRFELREALERGDLLRNLHMHFQIIDREHELADPFASLWYVAPGSIGEDGDFGRLLSQSGSRGVLVIARKTANGNLDIDEHAFRELYDFWRLMRH